MSTRPFIDTFRQVEAGRLLDELADTQRELVEAVTRAGTKGILTITLSYVPEGPGQISIGADIKAKGPQMARGRYFFFVDGNYNLSRNDPRQQELDIRVVDDAPTQPKTVAG